MDLKLDGTRALVTGSTSGIGAAISQMLAAEGAKVVVHGRNGNRAKSVVKAIRDAGGYAELALGDLTDESERSALINAAGAAFGGIDILVSNAGGDTHTDFKWLERPLDEWSKDYQQNTLSAVALIQAFVPEMKKRGWGRCIQISSRVAIFPYPDWPAYSAAKAALNNMTVSLSKALSGTGITSNAIMPGLIHTPTTDDWFEQLAKEQGSEDPEVGRRFALQQKVGQTVARVGQPGDIAFAVCMLASPLSDFVTGILLRVDGGATPTV